MLAQSWRSTAKPAIHWLVPPPLCVVPVGSGLEPHPAVQVWQSNVLAGLRGIQRETISTQAECTTGHLVKSTESHCVGWHWFGQGALNIKLGRDLSQKAKMCMRIVFCHLSLFCYTWWLGFSLDNIWLVFLMVSDLQKIYSLHYLPLCTNKVPGETIWGTCMISYMI